jgi:protein-S-isoprenylcysteine O-methyltransferase Ste14
MSLGGRVLLRGSISLLIVAALLFVPAGSLSYWQGWAFLGLVLAIVLFMGTYLLKRDPELLRRRMLHREKRPEQRRLKGIGVVVTLASLLLSGLDHRFGWSRAWVGPVPGWLSLVALGAVAGFYVFIFWVLSVNRFAARVIQVEPNQPVVSTGPYRVVRHPMYAGSVVLWLSVPVALGSYVASPVSALLIPIFVLRLLYEERFLRRELPGYGDYCERTRYRLIPFVW